MISNETSVGPQCLSCKKRRVKCDSTKPACTRCQRDRNECPGYVRPLKWNNLTSSICPAKRPRRTRHDVETQARGIPSRELVVSIPSSLGWPEREPLLLLDSIQYYNAQIVPDVVPTHQSLRRPEINFEEWQYMPQLLQRILIVIVRTTQAMKASIDSISKSDLYHYRGLVLTELKASISSAVVEPEGVILGCILLVMLAEIQLSATGSWTTHLEAARRIIRLRGGFGKCFNDLPWFSDLLIHYLTIDILSATTCSAVFLDLDSITAQAEYISLLPSLAGDIISNCCPCPQVLLQAIIHTNVLRVSSLQNTPASTPDSYPHTTFEEIICLIQTFDPSAWAETLPISNSSRSPTTAVPLSTQATPSSTVLYDTIAWTALALSYKSAALLYLLLSAPLPATSHSSYAQPSQHHHLIRESHSTLSQQLSFLFSLASSNPKAPLYAQLWKFVVWPLIVCTYVRVAFALTLGQGDEEDEHEGVEVDREIERLQVTAVALGARSLADAAVVMRRIVREKERDEAGVRNQAGRGRQEGTSTAWRWDDAWKTKCAFAI